MAKRYFPIKTETSCQLKWNWSTIRLYNGVTSSCHRVQGDLITVDTFDTFHNTPKKIADRKLMLEGKWPSGGCEYCRDIENAKGSSDRMFHMAVHNMTPPELDIDPTATTVTPTIVEIYFDNTCNMSCIYCWDGFSSQIQQENIKFGRFEQHGVVIDNRAVKVDNLEAITDKFWNWLTENHLHLKRLNALGGEPFYQRQFNECLDFFDQHPSPELEFNLVSNLMISSKKFKHDIQRIKKLVDENKIKRFDLTASIDCFGEEQEYVRYGLDLNQWRENFEYVVNEPWITLNINQTLSCLTIKTVPELLEYINPLRENRDIGHYFATTGFTHDFLHPKVFGGGFFDRDFRRIFKCMPTNTWQQRKAIKYMRGIHKELKQYARDQDGINRLGVLLDEIDRRRNLNWRTTFPWLVKEIQHVV